MRFSGVVSNWKNSWNDFNWISSKSGCSDGSRILPKLILPVSVSDTLSNEVISGNKLVLKNACNF
jgi:hypothetical protein